MTLLHGLIIGLIRGVIALPFGGVPLGVQVAFLCLLVRAIFSSGCILGLVLYCFWLNAYLKIKAWMEYHYWLNLGLGVKGTAFVSYKFMEFLIERLALIGAAYFLYVANLFPNKENFINKNAIINASVCITIYFITQIIKRVIMEKQ